MLIELRIDKEKIINNIEKIREIAVFPENLNKTISQLNEEQLNTPYRPEGWTIRQVVHHCADSHMNCFIRIKWALTEKEPVIKYYYEGLWGEGIDNKTNIYNSHEN